MMWSPPNPNPKSDWGAPSVRTGVLAAALLLASCAKADSNDQSHRDSASAPHGKVVVDGMISATVGDEKREWYVTHADSNGEWQSASFWRDGSMKSAHVLISGFTEKNIRPSGEGDMRLSMIVTSMGDSPQAYAPSMYYTPHGPVKTWASDENGDFDLTISHVSTDGDFLDMDGRFSGELVLGDIYESDFPGTIMIEDGTFAVRVRKND